MYKDTCRLQNGPAEPPFTVWRKINSSRSTYRAWLYLLHSHHPGVSAGGYRKTASSNLPLAARGAIFAMLSAESAVRGWGAPHNSGHSGPGRATAAGSVTKPRRGPSPGRYSLGRPVAASYESHIARHTIPHGRVPPNPASPPDEKERPGHAAKTGEGPQPLRTRVTDCCPEQPDGTTNSDCAFFQGLRGCTVGCEI